MSKRKVIEDNLAMLTYLMEECSEGMYRNGKLTAKGWLCDTATQAVSTIVIETERRKLIEELDRLSRKPWKHFLNQFHVWRFHFQLYDCLNDKFVFHYSYQGPGYWTPINDPRTQKVISQDKVLGKHIDEDGNLHV